MSTNPKTLLIVDDDEGMRDTLTAILRRDYSVLTAASGEAGLETLGKAGVDLMLLDVRLPSIGGLDVLKHVKEQYAQIEVIVISAVSEVEVAVQAIKQGAYHFITKDFDYDALRSLVRNASEKQDLSRQVASLAAQVADQQQSESDFVVGTSQAMRPVMDMVRKVAKTPATVLVQGESGTGKERLARLLHLESSVAQGPFLAVNLAAVPAELVESTLFGHEKGAFTGAIKQQLGKFEMAAGGTLFLDEIGDLRLDLQAKLLRALQEGEIERVGGAKPVRTDFRLIVATNVDLERAIRENRFREDLFYRINVIPIRMPPLRERGADIPELLAFFLRRYNTRFRKSVLGVSDDALAVLKQYWWPGNIREMQNLVERLVATDERGFIGEEDLPIELQLARLKAAQPSSDGRFADAVSAFERSLILRTLQECSGNVSAASRYLEMPLATLKNKIQKHRIRELGVTRGAGAARPPGEGEA
jgi:two-component system NtrC family response regulator